MKFNDAQYDEIMRTFYKKQIENHTMEEERKKEIYSKIPRIKEIDQKIALSSIDAVRSQLKNDIDHISETKDANKLLLEEKKNLLLANHYPEDYLQPIYTCNLCKDTGKLTHSYCTCFKQAAISLLYKESTLDQILTNENFDTFDLNYYSKEEDGEHPFTPFHNMSKILTKTKNFIKAFDKEGGNLLFYGKTGVGKTFLSHCIAKELLNTSHTVLYQSAIHLFENVCNDVIMNHHHSTENSRIYDYLFTCDLLIIDDLGTEYTNSFVSSELYDILNTRLRKQKSTIISTNLDLSELNSRYSDRITSRIFADYQVYNFYGENIRYAKRRNNIQK